MTLCVDIDGRFNGRILSFLERRNCLHRISSLSIEGQTQLKDWIKASEHIIHTYVQTQLKDWIKASEHIIHTYVQTQLKDWIKASERIIYTYVQTQLKDWIKASETHTYRHS